MNQKRKIKWKAYNKELIQRGSLTILFSEDIAHKWYNSSLKGSGFQKVYTDTAIEILSLIRFRFRLTLRATQGFVESLTGLIPKLSGLSIPDYSTLSRRLRKCWIDFGKMRSGEAIYTVVDSTGLKVFGEGEWKVRQHGYTKRRTWKKLHLCVNEKNSEIISASFTDNSFKDNELFTEMLGGLEEEVSKVGGDGAYDTRECWDFCRLNGIEGIFPPRKGAKIRKHGNCKGELLARDEHIRIIRRKGKKKWKKESGYSRRSIAETAMYRFKTLLGDKLSSREFNRQANEAFIKCKLLNMMSVPKVL